MSAYKDSRLFGSYVRQAKAALKDGDLRGSAKVLRGLADELMARADGIDDAIDAACSPSSPARPDDAVRLGR